ncbi:MAG: hypothetical protein HY791_27920 [Deltaproteobacteria bacterium]|nr:hypothetical protein [Deltaproteobacteria bacterium]
MIRTWLLRLRADAGDGSDLFSPMLVKEVRQGLKANTFALMLTVIQVLFSSVFFVALIFDDSNDTRKMAGTGSYVLVLGLLLLMPMVALQAVSSEANGKTLELLRLTKMGPIEIVRGKWISVVTQTLLILSTSFPYLALRIFLGGFDVQREVYMLLLALMGSFALSAWAIFTSTFSASILRISAFLGPLCPAAVVGVEERARLSWFVTQSSVALPVAASSSALLTLFFLDAAASRLAPREGRRWVSRRVTAAAFLLLAIAAAGTDAAKWTAVQSLVVASWLIVESLAETPITTAAGLAPHVRRGSGLVARARPWLAAHGVATLLVALALGPSALLMVASAYAALAPEWLVPMSLSYLSTLLFPFALSKAIGRGRVVVYYASYTVSSVLLAILTLTGARAAGFSSDDALRMMAWVPLAAFNDAVIAKLDPELWTIVVAVNSAFLIWSAVSLYLFMRQAVLSHAHLIREAKAIAFGPKWTRRA